MKNVYPTTKELFDMAQFENRRKVSLAFSGSPSRSKCCTNIWKSRKNVVTLQLKKDG
jgi:hypothetical protein